MERLIPNFDINKNKFIVLESSSNYFLLDLKDKKGSVTVGLQAGLDFDLLLINYENVDEIHFDVNENSHVNVASLMHFDKKELKISANIEQNSEFKAYFADFITGDTKSNVVINLNGENSI